MSAYVKIIHMTNKTVFMGSPEFAVSILHALGTRYQVCGVVTQPDKPAGRGKNLTPPPVKILAEQLGYPVIQPDKMKAPGVFEQLAAWAPDFIVVAAFGRILRQNVLELPRLGCINVHASYLPRWRGAAPIQAAILHGDLSTGVSIMLMDAGIDTGPVLMRERVIIEPSDDAITLTSRLASVGADLLLQALDGYLDGILTPSPQDEEGATYAPMINKEDGLLDFTLPAEALERRVRAYIDWPGAYMLLGDEVLKVRRAKVVHGNGIPGRREIYDGYPCINTSDGKLVLLEVNPAGKNWMNAADYLRGVRAWTLN